MLIGLCDVTPCSGRAEAGETIDEVDAGSSVVAGVGVAFIHIVLTVHPLEAGFTLQQHNEEC